MPKIKVTKAGGFKYGVGDARTQYDKGAVVLVKQKDARMLVAARLATIVEDDATPAPAPKVAAAKRTTATKTTAAKRRTYNRRDMKAK